MNRSRGGTYRRGKGWGFYFSYMAEGQRRQVKRQGFLSKKEAQQALTQALASVDGGRVLGAHKQTVQTFLLSWFETYRNAGRRKASTAGTTEVHVTRYLVPHLGSVLLRDLSPKIISELVATLLTSGRLLESGKGAGLSPKTVRNIMGTLRKALGDAVKWGLIPSNPVAHVEMPRYERPQVIAWDSDQAARFLTHATTSGDPLLPLWRLLLVTGLRRGELLGLRWQDIDLVEGTVTVAQARVIAGNRVVVSTPKTRAGRRTLSIDSTTVTLLAHLRNAQEAAGELLGQWPSDLVAVTAQGHPLDPKALLQKWREAAQAAGVPPITLHQGRHTAITEALQRGTPIHVVAGRVGHAQASTTVNTYAHFLPRADRQAADTVGSAFDLQIAQMLRKANCDETVAKQAVEGSNWVAAVSELVELLGQDSGNSAQTLDTENTTDPEDGAPPGIRT
jgi:integrase